MSAPGPQFPAGSFVDPAILDEPVGAPAADAPPRFALTIYAAGIVALFAFITWIASF